MRIVHVCETPVAGAMEALSSSIRDYTEHESRAINNGGQVNNLQFPWDAHWGFTELFPLMCRADVVVCHQNIDHQTQPLRDFLDGDRQKKICGFYHSHPDSCRKTLYDIGVPSFVIAQYQAALFPKATPVRNVIRFDRADFPKRKDRNDGKIWIGYSPTFRQTQKGQKEGSSIWHHSKGYDVTMPILEAIDQAHEEVEVVLFEGVPYDRCILGKASCDILIDEVVTGSYHRSTLEGLALGIPTIANLSPEVHGTLVRAADANDFPCVHATIDTLEEKLEWLLRMSKGRRHEMGDQCRDWMVRYWHPRDIAQKFCEQLEDLPTCEEVFDGSRSTEI